MTTHRQLKSAHIFFLIVALGNIGLLGWWWLSAHEISNESGPIENLQAAVLFLVFVIFCFNSMKLEGAGRTVAVIFCFLCFFMFFREVDFQDMTESDAILSITRGHTQKLIFWFSLLLMSGYIISQFIYFRAMVAAMLHWRAWPYYTWLVLIISGELTEEFSRATGNLFWDFVIPNGNFWEEMLELNAYMALMFASITLYEFSRFIYEREGHCAEVMPDKRSIFSRTTCVTVSTKA